MKNITRCLSLNKWSDLGNRSSHEILEKNVLPGYLRERRWFAGKGREVNSVAVVNQLHIPGSNLSPYLWLLRVEYSDQTNEKYLLPVCFIPDRQLPEEQMRPPLLCKISLDLENGWLCDGTWCEEFRASLLKNFTLQSQIPGEDESHMDFNANPAFVAQFKESQPSRVFHAEQSNTSIAFGDKFFFKLYRKVEPGINPDIELSRFLTVDSPFVGTPAWLGEVKWYTKDGPISVGILQQLLPGSTVAWNYLMPMIDHAIHDPGDNSNLLWQKLRQLGKLTSAMHEALGAHNSSADFAAESFTVAQQQALRTRVLSDVSETFELLKNSINKLPANAREAGLHLLDSQHELGHLIRDAYLFRTDGTAIRIHGDFHLGQVLVAGDQMLVTDFEGEPARRYDERRMKQPPEKDIAGMLRSFQYIIHTVAPNDDPALLEDVLHRMTDVYMRAYNNESPEINGVLRLFLIEKALYELRYEINNRPDWATIPIAGIMSVIKEGMVHHD
ncbi:MAG TPA: hypothetical protein VFE50_23225 [Cyclobacteriaceae bacterium]|nr:hypothetical protein [Cyclobacteriaceae bacterium]